MLLRMMFKTMMNHLFINVNGKRMMELASILLNMDEETIITEVDYKSYKEK